MFVFQQQEEVDADSPLSGFDPTLPVTPDGAHVHWLTCLEIHFPLQRTTLHQKLHMMLLCLKLRGLERKPLLALTEDTFS